MFSYLLETKPKAVTNIVCKYVFSTKSIANYSCVMPRQLLSNEPLKKKLKISRNSNSKFHSSDKMSRKKISSNNDNIISKSAEKPVIDSFNIVEEVRYLETPTKSENDKKEYRVIQLQNGLTALLIADTHDRFNDGTENNSCNDATSSASSGSESNGESSDSENEISDDDECKEASSDEENNMGKKGKSPKKEEKMAACGLCIGVGSFSDPPEIPGLAHFLEHMVFMGSKKYPKENDFDAFIQKCGGFDNASTEPEQTTFYFEIVEKHLFSALDRFAQFFVSPLMLRDAITREREAVESEFQMALPSDFHRKEQLFCSLAQPGHPATKFTWGNLVTLRDNVTEDKLYEKLHKFRERHYSAHRMTLAIQARLPLDTLEEYVKSCFSNIPSNNLAADDFTSYKGVKSFDTHDFRRIYKIKPIKDVCQIELTWTMPPLHHLYRIKPHQYLSWIIGHEGKGSLISYLRKKMWCLDITCGNSEGGFEHSSMFALFSLSLMLTNEGYAHLKEILDATFAYINMVRKFGPQKRIYDEIRAIEEINFKFVDEEPPIEYVEQLCENMHFYAPADYITGSNLYWDYDPVSIKDCMDVLTPENVNIIIFNKQFDEEKFCKTEVWFNTKYTDEIIPKEWIDCWKELEPFREFHLPESNIYLTDDFTLIPLDKSYEFPQKIYQDSLYELWYKPDSKFRLPECYMSFHLITPSIPVSPEGMAMADLMIIILKHLLVEELYPAIAAELKYEIYPSKKGLIMGVSGFNQKLPLLLQTVINSLSKCSELVTEDIFRVMKTELLKAYYNKCLKPSKLEKSVRLSILLLTEWTAVERYDAIKDVSFEEFKHFVKSCTKHLHIQGLVQGNISKDDVIKNVLSAFKSLDSGPLLANTLPQIRTMSLPLGAHCCRLKNYNSTDSNSLVTNYYQSNSRSIALSVIIDLFIMIIEEPLFNELRTQQQLGYDVSCLLRDTYGVLGYSITVCTQADKYSTGDVDSRIEKFLESFSDKLNSMPEEEFEGVKKALIKIKRCADVQLREEVTRNWAEITAVAYLFDRLTREVEEIEKVSIQQIRDWFKDHRSGGRNCKKLSMQIVGSRNKNGTVEEKNCKNNEDTETMIQNCNTDRLVLEYFNNSNDCESKLHYDSYITDIEKFKDKLYIYPVNCTET